MATNISNLGKGIVFENVLNQNGVFDKIKIPRKKSLFKPFFYLNRASIALANKKFFKVHTLKKEKVNEKFLDVIFPFYGKKVIFTFLVNMVSLRVNSWF